MKNVRFKCQIPLSNLHKTRVVHANGEIDEDPIDANDHRNLIEIVDWIERSKIELSNNLD